MSSAMRKLSVQCFTRLQHTSVYNGFNLSRFASASYRLHSNDSASPNSKPRKGNTPIGKFDDGWEGEREKMTPAEDVNAYAPFPEDTNPETGEVGGPRGPEPTRYGDWERKGRCVDF